MPQVINNLDLKKNEIQNVVLQPLSTPPSNPKLGQKYFNINDNNEYRWNGTAWVTYQAPLPSQAGNSGKFLTTNGSALSWTNTSAKLLPTVTSSDNGKVLAGVDGAWQAVELSSLLTIYNGETS